MNIRPQTLAEYIGQEQIKPSILRALEGAKSRHEPLDHVLLYGSAGLGKTTLANVLASEMGCTVVTSMGTSIEKPSDLVAILIKINKPNTLFFMDEIHRLPKTAEEVLYPAMEDGILDTTVGNGMSARGLRLKMPSFTFVGATTRISLMSDPLRDRFGNQYALQPYTVDELSTIIKFVAPKIGVSIDDPASTDIARRSRGVARVANRLLARVRDYSALINVQVVDQCMADLHIDGKGLTDQDRHILHVVKEMFNLGPVGLQPLAAASGVDPGEIRDVIEPFLIRQDLLSRTPRGRVITQAGLESIQ